MTDRCELCAEPPEFKSCSHTRCLPFLRQGLILGRGDEWRGKWKLRPDKGLAAAPGVTSLIPSHRGEKADYETDSGSRASSSVKARAHVYQHPCLCLKNEVYEM